VSLRRRSEAFAAPYSRRGQPGLRLPSAGRPHRGFPAAFLAAARGSSGRRVLSGIRRELKVLSVHSCDFLCV
jgi:hypothetical protein